VEIICQRTFKNGKRTNNKSQPKPLLIQLIQADMEDRLTYQKLVNKILLKQMLLTIDCPIHLPLKIMESQLHLLIRLEMIQVQVFLPILLLLKEI